MKNKRLIWLLGIGIITFCLMGASLKKNDTLPAQTEYMTIVIEGYNSKYAHITLPGENVKAIKLDSKMDGFNHIQTLEILSDYNRQGWTVQSSNLVGQNSHSQGYTYFLLERSKE